MEWQTYLLTAKLATLVAVLLLIVGLPIAYWIAFSRWRWKFLVEAIVALPLILPPTVLGFYLLYVFGSHTSFGRWYQHVTGSPLAFSFRGLVIGSILYSLPFAVQPFVASFTGVDQTLVAASSTLGASNWKTFRRIIFPLSLPGIVTGCALTFAHTVGEFGVVLMIGGNIPGVTRTVSIDVYDRVQAVDYASANQTALVLLIFSFLVLSFVYSLNRKGRGVSPLQ